MLDKGVGQVSKLEAQPEVKTKLLRTFGLVYENLGEYGKSRALLGDGLKLARETYGGETEDAAMLEKALAELARRAGSFDEAERLAKQSLATRRKVLGTKSAFTAESLNTVALTLFDKGEYKQAEPYFQELLGMRPTLRERPHLETAVLSNAGALYQNLGENARAEELLRECIAIRRRQLGNLHPRLGLALTKLASVMLSMNRLDEAAGMQLEALAIYKKVHGQLHPDVARTLSGLGRTRTEQGRFEEAEQFLAEAQTVIDKTVGDRDRDAAALYLKGQLRVAQRRWAEAEAAFRQARAVREKAVGPGHVNTARAVMALSLVLLEEGKAEEARALFEEARKVLDDKLKAKVDRGEFLEAAARAAYRGGLAGKHPKIGALETRLARN
jgi:tetratricopeptide (TPR) repeat protein